MNKVIVKGIAGMGNRLITLSAAIDYAKKTNRKIYVDWNDGMYAPMGENAFDSYFLLDESVAINKDEASDLGKCFPRCAEKLPVDFNIYDYFKYINKAKRYPFVNRVLLKVSKCLHKIGIPISFRKYMLYFEQLEKGEKYKPERISRGDNLSLKIKADTVLFIDFEPGFSPETMLKSIQLKPEIEEAIDLFLRQKGLEENAVGLHLRATDKKANASITKFISYLKEFCEKNYINKVYLATDNAQIEQKIIASMPDKIVTYPKYLPDLTNAGRGGIHHWASRSGDQESIRMMAEQSVMDMFILSKLEYLFYQNNSAFSKISVIYHKNKEHCYNWLEI